MMFGHFSPSLPVCETQTYCLNLNVASSAYIMDPGIALLQFDGVKINILFSPFIHHYKSNTKECGLATLLPRRHQVWRRLNHSLTKPFTFEVMMKEF